MKAAINLQGISSSFWAQSFTQRHQVNINWVVIISQTYESIYLAFTVYGLFTCGLFSYGLRTQNYVFLYSKVAQTFFIFPLFLTEDSNFLFYYFICWKIHVLCVHVCFEEGLWNYGIVHKINKESLCWSAEELVSTISLPEEAGRAIDFSTLNNLPENLSQFLCCNSYWEVEVIKHNEQILSHTQIMFRPLE